VFLSGSWHPIESLGTAEIFGARIALVPSLLSGLPRRGRLGAKGALRDPCASGAKDPLMEDGSFGGGWILIACQSKKSSAIAAKV